MPRQIDINELSKIFEKFLAADNIKDLEFYKSKIISKILSFSIDQDLKDNHLKLFEITYKDYIDSKMNPMHKQSIRYQFEEIILMLHELNR